MQHFSFWVRHGWLLVASWIALLPTTAWGQEALEVAMRVGGAQLPVESEELRVEIDSQHASTRQVQVYVNDTPGVVEGQFELRLAEGSAVTGYAYWNGEQKVVGKVFERQAAREIYNRVTTRRRDPGLLEKLGEGRFGFKVFPIAPGEAKRVQVEHAAWLHRRGHRVTYRAPLGSRRASVVVEIRDSRGVGAVRSATHRLHVERTSEDRVRLRATGGSGSELHVEYEVVRAPALSVQMHRDEGQDGYFNLVFNPQLARTTSDTAKQVTLVIDRSGSMAGEAFAQAQRAAAQIVERLGPSDSVNVIWFDDDIDTLFTRPRVATRETRRQALSFIRDMGLGGGTNIARALGAALEAQDDRESLLPVVLFMTDGQSNTQLALEASERDERNVRVFTIGVGPNVDGPFLSRLAKSKRGQFTFIERASAIESRVAQLYSQIEEPLLVDLELEIDGIRVQRRYPRSLPDLFRNDEIRISGRFRGDGPARFTLRGKHGGQSRQYTAHLPTRITRRPWVGRLWARARVDDLLEELALRGHDPELRDEVVSLSLAYDFVTPFTAFLAIPESELTADTAQLMAQAEARRAEARARHDDATLLDDDAEEDVQYSSPMALDDGDAVFDPQDTLQAKSLASRTPPKNGCGACWVGLGTGPAPHTGISSLLLLLGALLRRRRPRS